MLLHTEKTLPAHWYFDAGHFQRELEGIWLREWLCVGRASEWAGAGMFRVIRVGTQQIVITRDGNGELHAFHNTCRHRGSLLCETLAGQFSRERIVCPYHAWTYSLDGHLLRTPRKVEAGDFRPEDFSLYRVALQTWAGFVFINLERAPGSGLQATLGDEVSALSNWPLADLALAHNEVHVVDCNWKIFWENFLECYHCPNIHRDLCRLVPVYGLGLVSPDDLPPGHALRRTHAETRLAAGAVTWSTDGTTRLPWFPGLTPQEQSAGMTFANILPSAFIVAHVDYVRAVLVLPLGPEQTELSISWLVQEQALAAGDIDIARLTAFGRQVVLEDTRVCELNQKGLHSLRHQHGVLVPQEYDVYSFDQWVLTRLEQGTAA